VEPPLLLVSLAWLSLSQRDDLAPVCFSIYYLVTTLLTTTRLVNRLAGLEAELDRFNINNIQYSNTMSLPSVLREKTKANGRGSDPLNPIGGLSALDKSIVDLYPIGFASGDKEHSNSLGRSMY
jgi:hypothetical protein